MSFAQFLEADRRLVILKALEAAAEYRINELLLQRYCQTVGHSVSLDRLQADLAWLAEQGLLKYETTQGIGVATLLTRGLDVAAGRATVPGVQKPRPGE